MGRMYSIIMDAVSVSAVQDLVRVSAPSDAILVVHEVTVTQQSTETSDSGAIQLQRATTDGTGSAYIAKLLQSGDSAFGGSAVTDLTADTTAGDVLYREGFNVLSGYRKLFTPEQRPVIPPSGRFVVRSDETITAATLTCELIIEEIG